MKTLLITTILISTCFLMGHTQASGDPVNSYVSAELPDLVDLYRELHRNPELSLQEEKTSALLASALRDIGFEVSEHIAGYGVVAMLRNGEGPQILYRTDMDALPITEQTGLEYASTVEVDYNGSRSGVMHACGHDVHMSTWYGVAKAMAHFRDRWRGTLMLIAQPAEEIGQGAVLMLGAGLYAHFGVPDYGLAFHTNAVLPAGQIAIDPGYIMARAESVDIRIFGRGAHGAQPQAAIDPVVIASMIVVELQTIVSRNVDPTDIAVITVGAIQGGVKHNIIPEEVVLKLTVRTFTEEVRELVHRRIREICNGVALAAGMPEDRMPEISYEKFDAPPVYNDPVMVERLRVSAVSVVGEENITSLDPQTIAEDFAMYGSTEEDIPTVLYFLGTAPEDRVTSGDLPGLHTPRYYPDAERSIATGVLLTTRMLMDLFNE
jgi:hippurate hydrolase